ncbi:uncharacterized protein LOC135834235 [Planococcus citri]|uniref:uncharacterized protein LOC135834235 n=1 Tax=Planococcus citri TaxID=170843 RepID=UPI0031F8DC51
MIRDYFILLAVLTTCSGYSFGLHTSYANMSTVYFSARENITLICTGYDEEVMWTVLCPSEGIYSIKQESGGRKLVEIKNATAYNIGEYVCYSTANKKEFVQIHLRPDDSAFAISD